MTEEQVEPFILGGGPSPGTRPQAAARVAAPEGRPHRRSLQDRAGATRAAGRGPSGILLRVPGTPELLLRLGVVIAVAFGAIYLGYQIARFEFDVTPSVNLVEIFDLDAEATLPSWYSAVQLLLVALALVTVGSGFAGARRRDFSIAAGVALVASADEVVSFHERLNDVMDLGPPLNTKWWVVPGVLVVALLAYTLRHMLTSLGRRTGRLLVLGIAVYFLGALGFEASSAVLATSSTEYAVEVALEECAELLGQTIVLYALAAHVTTRSLDRRSQGATTN